MIDMNPHGNVAAQKKLNFLYRRPLYESMDEDSDTIITFESPYKLKDLGLGTINPDNVPEYPIDQQVFNIRMANSQNIREKAELLIKKKYSWRGYSYNEKLKTEPNKITLIADTKGRTVGTMTLCLDGEIGLPADENFHDKLDELRIQGCKISEPSKLAIEENVPKRVFAAMIHIAFIYGHRIHGCTDWVIEVNPRHAMFYKRMLGFQNYGETRTCTRVDAPAVLLRLKLEYMAEQAYKFGGLMEQHGKEKSFYPYFFPKWDEPGIADRLKTGRT